MYLCSLFVSLALVDRVSRPVDKCNCIKLFNRNLSVVVLKPQRMALTIVQIVFYCALPVMVLIGVIVLIMIYLKKKIKPEIYWA